MGQSVMQRANEHPLDTCHCGDYRRDHKDGVGPCIFSTGSKGDGHFGAGRCDQFRLDRRHIMQQARIGMNDGEYMARLVAEIERLRAMASEGPKANVRLSEDQRRNSEDGMNDIVERLRQGLPCLENGGNQCRTIEAKFGCDCAKAADEIERLRAELKREREERETEDFNRRCEEWERME